MKESKLKIVVFVEMRSFEKELGLTPASVRNNTIFIESLYTLTLDPQILIMIQRIQTFYFFLAFAAVLASYFFSQLSVKPEIIELSEIPLSQLLSGLLGGISLANLFNFKKRRAQLAIGRWTILLGFFTFGLFCYFYIIKGGVAPGFALVMPLLVVVFTSLANKNIKKDEELVNSSNRIR
jgi:peptidoglycan/LPS O-acetylase OafA/YrhL